jgi:hypothetical protein
LNWILLDLVVMGADGRSSIMLAGPEAVWLDRRTMAVRSVCIGNKFCPVHILKTANASIAEVQSTGFASSAWRLTVIIFPVTNESGMLGYLFNLCRESL